MATDVREAILSAIRNEREYQVSKWGSPEEDAANNTPADFTLYITHFATKWFKGGLPPHDTEDFETSMLKVASLAVAAIEASRAAAAKA